jgi:subfamily B ATP-binding cassette protein MsbA
VAALILLYNPIKSIGNSFNNVQIALMAMDRVFELMNNVPKICDAPDAEILTDIGEGIEYKDVCFSYVTGKPVLENINLKINRGETIALVGNSGGGKSTFVSLLPRFYDVSQGHILINHKDIRSYTRQSLRQQMSIVFQDNYLFAGTIRDNIMLGKADATEEELQQAVKSAYVDAFVKDLPNGLDTPIGERGALLSGGQKQRIAIARAFLKNAPIVILDEATSALDNKSEAEVQKAIDNLMADRTVIVIAHRLSTVRHADKIVVINYGKIAEIGTHDELLNNPNSIYGALYHAQMK